MPSFDLASSSKVAHLDLTKKNECLKVKNIGGLILPKGTAAQRASDGVEAGAIRFNTDTNVLEYYDGTSWKTVPTAAALSLADDADYTISTYGGGHISTGTSTNGSFVDVDATNAKLDFEVSNPGLYKVEFKFSQYIELTAAANAGFVIIFQLTDGTTTSPGLPARYKVNGNAGQNPQYSAPFNLSHEFEYTTTGSKSVKIQKRVIDAASVATSLLIAETSTNRLLTMTARRVGTA